MLFSSISQYKKGEKSYLEIQKIFYGSTLNSSYSISNGLRDNMKTINSDYVAWINIDGSIIDYPIVAESSSTNYLTHDFNKYENIYGCLFINQPTPFKSGNTIVYGHNLKNGEMFGSLKKYLSESYFNGHRLITIYFDNQVIKYYVFSVQIEDIAGKAYTYDISPKYLSDMRDASLVISEDPELINATNIITLSTCYQSTKRLLIQAYKGRDLS